jgi:hypothetical protein
MDTDYELLTYQGGYATYTSPDGFHAQVLLFTDNGHAHEVLKTFKGETAHTSAERLCLDYVIKFVHSHP